MITPQMQAAYDQLATLDTQIAEARSNISVLEAIGSPRVIELKASLQQAVQKRGDIMRAIEAQRNKAD